MNERLHVSDDMIARGARALAALLMEDPARWTSSLYRETEAVLRAALEAPDA